MKFNKVENKKENKRNEIKIEFDKNMKNQLFNSLQEFETLFFFDSNDYYESSLIKKKYDIIVSIGKIEEFTYSDIFFEDLNTFTNKQNDWIFGYFSYEIKNKIENSDSSKHDFLQFPEVLFFRPEIVITIKNSQASFLYYNHITNKKSVEKIISEFQNYEFKKSEKFKSEVKIKSVISEKEYLQATSSILKHIKRGDIYEANYCFEFSDSNAEITAHEVFLKLNEISPSPFAVYLKDNNKFLISSSPERFLKKTGNKIFAQPMKGTAKRSQNLSEDQYLSKELSTNTKERAENIMIVDLLRNDLSKIATRKSVKVAELCKVYKFKNVFQMISTIEAEIEKNKSFSDILKATFPPGSMTGAPKIRAIQIIEEYEKSRRGLYSGSVGFVEPNGDFDFNVVIRSILYNSENNYLSFSVGSAITANSDLSKEYQECLLKAKSMLQVFQTDISKLQ